MDAGAVPPNDAVGVALPAPPIPRDSRDSGCAPLAAGAAPLSHPFDLAHLPALDGLRFLALAQVVLYHGGWNVIPGDGVTFFFVLSGFLFAVLLDRERRATGTVDLRAFYTRRLFRIVPAFYVAVLATIAGKWLCGASIDWGHALASLTFSANYYNALYNHPPTGFSSYWSLAVEEQFYLLWPISFLFFQRFSRRALIAFLFASIGLVCAWRSLALLQLHAPDAYAYDAFETRFDSLAIGCLVGLLTTRGWFRRGLRAVTRTGLEPLATLFVIAATDSLGPRWHHSVGFTVDSALMALLLLQLVCLGWHPLWRWLNLRWVAFLGTLSYSGYLYHHWGLVAGAQIPGVLHASQVVAGLAATLVLAAISWSVVEQPCLRLRKRWEKAAVRDHSFVTTSSRFSTTFMTPAQAASSTAGRDASAGASPILSSSAAACGSPA
jgi:peptidoglycan/LPS O-acetylase OafA/YrhL